MALNFERIASVVNPPVATITLDDPEHGNALGDTMRQELLQALLSAQEDGRVRVVVITGRGDQFCSGVPSGEIEALRQGNAGFERVRPLLDEGRRIVSLLSEFPKPVVAALNGPARGEGAALALACDLRLAAPTASLSFDFAADGLGPAWGTSATLTRLAGEGRALDLLWTGRVLEPSEAENFGLVTRATRDLQAELTTVVTDLSARDESLLHLTRMAIESSHACDLATSLDLETEIQHRCWGSSRDGNASPN